MKTGLCPRCGRRLIVVTLRCHICRSAGHFPRAVTRTVVRRHACGTCIEPRRVLDLTVRSGGKFA